MSDVIERLLLGESRAMQNLRALIVRLAPRAMSVCIQGESGVGKELVARALHDASGRRGAFVPFNVCALPETMFEASLFGHVRGAFSGAISDCDGFLSQAHLGTIFLDEIGGLGPTVQPKLLRAVELGVYRPVGARQDRRSEFRVVAATNDDISNLVARGMFRTDLAYRLRGCVVKVPPLRERPEDIAMLATHFLHQNAIAFGGPRVFCRDAFRLMEGYAWPGNVRELKSVVDCAAMLSTAEAVDGEAMRDALWHQHSVGPASASSSSGDCEIPVERARMIADLEAVDWDTNRLAAERKVSRATIYRRMARLAIHPQARLPGSRPATSNQVR